MKAIFIDAVNRKKSDIDFQGDYKEIQKQIGCDCFTCVELENGDTLFVDDEGLINGEQNFFAIDGAPYQPYAGNGLILGTNHSTGDSTDCKSNAKDINTIFMDRMHIAMFCYLTGSEPTYQGLKHFAS
jgi:hypothetical protein